MIILISIYDDNIHLLFIYIYTTDISGSRILLAESLFQECDILVITELQLFHRLYCSVCSISHSVIVDAQIHYTFILLLCHGMQF